MDTEKISNVSCLHFPVEHRRNDLFFSLVDYRNSYFMSDDPKKIIEFYNGFENRDQLIQWMRERPKGVANIHEVDGDKEIIVVIPTADFNGKYAKECRDNIFKGLHIIFVESGGSGESYFNFAHNVNVGIRKAIEYKPKWVVYSNDDMIGIDPPERLIALLKKVNGNPDVLFCTETLYHSYAVWISRIRYIFFLRSKFSSDSGYAVLLRRLEVKYSTVGKSSNSIRKWIYTFLYFKKLKRLIQIGSFGIFSYEFLVRKHESLFDETFINHMEDFDLSLFIFKNNTNFDFLDYRIGDIVGGTIGNGKIRKLRSIASQAYFNYKFRNENCCLKKV